MITSREQFAHRAVDYVRAGAAVVTAYDQRIADEECRLPADLRGTADAVHVEHVPFVPLYRTRDEFAAAMSNQTVHGVMQPHVGAERRQCP